MLYQIPFNAFPGSAAVRTKLWRNFMKADTVKGGRAWTMVVAARVQLELRVQLATSRAYPRDRIDCAIHAG
jgi:hypothetical protein